MPTVVEAQVLTLLRQGDLAAAATLAQQYDLPSARHEYTWLRGILLQHYGVGALRQQMDEKGWRDERFKIMILQAIAHDRCPSDDEHADDEKEQAVQQLMTPLLNLRTNPLG